MTVKAKTVQETLTKKKTVNDDSDVEKYQKLIKENGLTNLKTRKFRIEKSKKNRDFEAKANKIDIEYRNDILLKKSSIKNINDVEEIKIEDPPKFEEVIKKYDNNMHVDFNKLTNKLTDIGSRIAIHNEWKTPVETIPTLETTMILSDIVKRAVNNENYQEAKIIISSLIELKALV